MAKETQTKKVETPKPSGKEYVFDYDSKIGYVLKGKTIVETNDFCKANCITIKDLVKATKGKVATIILDK